ncbi:MAG: ATP-binding protein [Clostridiales bacterium]|nr:ATP-binding protein [Clostridiales bacterium]
MATNAYDIMFKSDTFRVKQEVRGILNFIRKNLPSLSDEDAYDLRLIFSELLFNAAIHGNNKDTTKTVRVRVEISDGVIFSTITDEGIGFDYMSLMSMFDENQNIMNENGRGIQLAYSLADSLAFNITGNKIKFYKKVAANG